ncbi:ATP-grasp domain-containing protein [Amycolatopsis marina]|uniref:ATP-grasp domain-containing protein n=1 Tax=Amycolatopsis marina TaxID=490629 RepID=UPI0015A6E502|nr:ATP-grasp domain-containing protein [Amycolatopsis marina]
MSAPAVPTAGEVEIEGVPADLASTCLREYAPELFWYDRSPFLSESARSVLPWLRYEHRDHRAEGAANDGQFDSAVPEPTPAPTGRIGVSFAPEDGVGAYQWAATRDLRLLAPEPAVAEVASDKIDSLRLFREAGVGTPESWVVIADPADATRCWKAAGGRPVVVQRRFNNLTGKGTRLATAPDELGLALQDWRGETLRVSEYLPGIPLTVSGCVAGDVTVISAISHQLVGLPELTPFWGAHCGNQLVADHTLPAGAAARCRQAGRRLGDRLGELGFRGAFGLDLVATPDGSVAAIEINPRFQTVVSLVQAQETAAGLLPMLGTHALATLLPAISVSRVRTACLTLSQLVVAATRRGRLKATVESGAYRLEAGELRPLGPGELTQLRPGEALLWCHAAPGDLVHPGNELVLVQLPCRVAESTERPELNAEARNWIDAIRRRLISEDV